MKLATIGINYPQTRLVLNGKVPGVEYYSYQNWYNPFLKKVFHTYEVYWPFLQGHIDAYHTVNTVVKTEKPWCCSFETLVPRTNRFNKKRLFEVFNMMCKDNCKQLIAFSDCNYNLQMEFMKDYPEYAKVLNPKTCKITIPQPLLLDAPKDMVNHGVLKFFFVGNDFVRKGCTEIIQALTKLRKKRQDFELIMITRIQQTQNYAFKNMQDSREYINGILHLVEEAKDYIHLYPHLPFEEVKKIMSSCDVGLLPTWAESYGYSVLEMQACGLPVVTTNIRALPETNVCGWKVKLTPGKPNFETIDIKNIEHKKMLRQQMVNDLYDIFDYILDNREEVLERGQRSYNFIADVHSPVKYTETIGNVYRKIF